MKAADLWPLAKQTVKEFLDDRAPRLGAALAFYTALSLSPMLLMVIAIAGAVYGPEAARGELASQIQDMVGREGAEAIQTMLANHRSEQSSIWMTIVSVGTLVVGATGVFAQLQDALDTVWDIEPDTSSGGIWQTIKSRLLSFSLICGLAFLLLVSLVFHALLNGLDHWIGSRLGIGEWWLALANQTASFLLTAAMFAVIFKVLPHAHPTWSDVWVGALLTAGLFTLGKFLIGLYLGSAAPGSTYGAAGSFVVLLVWIYYSTQILLFGAEFTQVHANKYGSGLNGDLRDKSAKREGQPQLVGTGAT